MRSLLLVVGVACVAAVVGCGSAASSSSAPAQAPTAASTADRTSPQPSEALHERLVGRWGPTLPRAQARSVALTRWALATPPDEPQFEKMSPTQDERTTFRSLIRLQATEPDSPLLETVRKKLADYDAMLVVITPDEIAFGGDGADRHEPYRIVDARGDTLTIQAGSDRIEVRFLDTDHISMRSDQTLLLTRDVPGGYNAKDLRGELPTGVDALQPEQPGAASSASSPASGDACSEYADCIDKMPQLPGDQPAMLGSSSAIRTWERTPERLRLCASALELARSAGLCP